MKSSETQKNRGEYMEGKTCPAAEYLKNSKNKDQFAYYQTIEIEKSSKLSIHSHRKVKLKMEFTNFFAALI